VLILLGRKAEARNDIATVDRLGGQVDAATRQAAQ
jgi:hypothetical protein